MNEPADGQAVRLKTQDELVKEEEEKKLIEEKTAQMERAIQGQRIFVSKFANMNKLRIESFMREGQRYCSLVDPKSSTSERKVVVRSMKEQEFLQFMLQYIAELQQKHQNTGGQWEEAKSS